MAAIRKKYPVKGFLYVDEAFFFQPDGKVENALRVAQADEALRRAISS